MKARRGLMKIFFYLSFLMTFLQSNETVAVSQRTWLEYIDQELIAPKSYELFEDLEHARQWRADPEFVVENENLTINKKEVTLKCHSSKLFPSHPYQNTKEYHAAMMAQFNHFTLPADSIACQISNQLGKICVKAGSAKIVVTSDLYVDECGNNYRAYWVSHYYSHHESMGTLFSKGRTAYKKEGSAFRGDYVTGQTYPLHGSDFIYLTEINEKDKKRLDKSLEQINQFFTKKDLIFIPRK